MSVVILKYVSVPLEEVKEYLELEDEVTCEYSGLSLESVDYVNKTLTIREPEIIVLGTSQVQSFVLTFQEFIDNLLSNYDANILVADIDSITMNGSISSITVRY
jgi:hypothetical protein